MDIPIGSTQFHSAQLKELQRLVPQIMWSSRAMVALANIDFGGAAIPIGGGGGGGTWGSIVGTLSNQTDLQNALNALSASIATKQNTLVSGTNLKTVNGNSLLGSGDIVISGAGGTWGSITGTLSSQTDLQNALNAKAPLVSPSFTTPALGTPSGGNLSSCTGYSVANLANLGANVATLLQTFSSANLLAALTTKTGTGLAVFNDTPTIINPNLTGIISHPGADQIAGTAVSGNVIDFTVGKNVQSLGGSITATFGGSPPTDRTTVWAVACDATSRTVTLPANVRSVGQQTVVSNIVFPANWAGYITFIKTAAGYDMIGEPISLQQRGPSGVFSAGGNDDKEIVLYVPFAGTLTNFITHSQSGTATYTLKINTTAVTGGANAVSTTLVNSTLTANNVVAKGDKIVITRSADSTCVNGAFTVLITPNQQ